MYRKIAILISMFFLCLGLDNCKSPEAPEAPNEPEPNYEYRYNVKVVFTHAQKQKAQNVAMLYCYIYDPTRPDWDKYDTTNIEMEKIGLAPEI